MNNSYVIKKSTEQEVKYVQDSLDAFNAEQVPFTQDPSFIDFNYVIKNQLDEIIGGMIGVLYCWGMLYINILWIAKEYREQGLGSELIRHAFEEAKSLGGSLAHLDTFDFQAKEFYLKLGFEVFGELEDCPANHTRYYLKKKIS
jgi:ribosomal protein S18 acetylase RimI-like enzyme